MSDHRLETTTDFGKFAVPGTLPSLEPGYVTGSGADQHLLALDRGGTVRGRASLWWSNTPPLLGERVGYIGHYAAETSRAAADLLSEATHRLQQADCTLAVAPVDGNTFHSYRFVTQRTFNGLTHPTFFLEPNNPERWPKDMLRAGFSPLAEYESSITELTGPDKRLEAAQAKAATHGISIRMLDPANFDRELSQIYPVVMAAFESNLLFSPIDKAEFFNLYSPMRSVIQPELTLFAEHEGTLVGFLFAPPDLAQAQRGETVDTVILKTLATIPAMWGLGIGTLLTAYAHTNAFNIGYRHAIHALMRRANHSLQISAHYTQPLRRYTLFARDLRAIQTASA